MSDDPVVETVYGTYHKYEIVKKTSLFGSTKFYVRKDGAPFKGSFGSLKAAVACAERAGK